MPDYSTRLRDAAAALIILFSRLTVRDMRERRGA